jgi:hypothetical protein
MFKSPDNVARALPSATFTVSNLDVQEVSVASSVIGHRLDNPGFNSQQGQEISFSPKVQTSPGVQRASCSMAKRVLSRGVM